MKALLFGAIVVGGWSNARRAFFALPRLDFNMSVLMTTAVIGAIAIGEWHEGAVVAVLFAVSDWLEAWTYGRARRSIRDLIDLAPKRATVKRDGGEVGVPIEELVVGDIVVIRPGEKIPVDGVVVRGESAVDEAAITGESIPREKAVGADVYAGTLNTYGALEVRVREACRRNDDCKNCTARRGGGGQSGEIARVRRSVCRRLHTGRHRFGDAHRRRAAPRFRSCVAAMDLSGLGVARRRLPMCARHRDARIYRQRHQQCCAAWGARQRRRSFGRAGSCAGHCL